MQLETFLLERWIDEHQTRVRHNLALSTGPKWSLPELRSLMTDEERDRFDRALLTYCPGAGRASLRAALGALYGASGEEIQIFTGGAEALLALFFLAAEPGANVIVPHPSFPPFSLLPAALGLQVRHYELRHEHRFALDPSEIERLVDARTKLILVNSPHNPSGAVASEATILELDAIAARRGIQLVVDEVYHPIYHGPERRSAGEYSRATVLGDFSKAFSLPGLRVGWLLERDAARRKRLANARGYFTVSSAMPAELLAEVAVNHRQTFFDRARSVSGKCLAALTPWIAAQNEVLEWIPPQGGMTAFPRFRSGLEVRKLCEAAAARGVLLAPGECFGFDRHVRVGFGLEDEEYPRALEILADVVAEFTA
jgi:aspartate/methionine/tyrosine aminotransferase